MPTPPSPQSKSSPSLSHIDAKGDARMIDIGDKDKSQRKAIAHGIISMSIETLNAIEQGDIKKGNVLASARIAAIMAAKKTAEIIPLCHPIALSSIEIDFKLETKDENGQVEVRVLVAALDRTGVEMEALHAVSTALLTIYDMGKAIDRTMVIGPIKLLHKSGGKSGLFEAE